MIGFKRLAAWLLMLTLLIPGLSAAETLSKQNDTTGYAAMLDDEAGLLEVSDDEAVLSSMMQITEYCNVGLYTYSGSSTSYVIDKARAWGNRVFSGEYTMLIIDMATRQLAVFSSDGILQVLTQAKAYSITDNIYSYASRGEYARCAMSAFNQMFSVLNGKKIAEPMRYVSNALLALLAAILVAYLVISARLEQEVRVSLPDIVTATAGAGAVIAAKRLVKKVRHQSSSGGGGGFHGGGGGGGFHGGGGGGGSHGF